MREDTAWKQVITSLFREFMEFFFPEIARDIDFSVPINFWTKNFSRFNKSPEPVVRLWINWYRYF